MAKLNSKQKFEKALEEVQKKMWALMVENELLKMELKLYRGKDEKDG